MKITPMAANPASIPTIQGSGAQTSSQASARERAISMLTNQAPVQNPSAVQPEEISAIHSGQNTTIEDESQLLDQQEASSTSETPDTSPAEEPKAEDPALSSQFAALARREKQMRAQAQRQAQEFKAREEALKAREAELSSKYKEPDYSSYIPKEQLKSDALRVLAEAGVSYEELTNQILNQAPVDPRAEARAAALEAKIAKLEQTLENSQKSQVTAQEEQYKAAIRQIESDAKRLVFTDPNYEMVKATGSYKDVVELIESNWKENGEILSVEEAAQQVEDYLVLEAEKLAKIEKIRKRLALPTSTAAASQPQQTQSGQAPQKQAPQMKTLTNQSAAPRQLSARERAILAFKGEKRN